MHLTITIALLGLGALALLKVASVLVTASSRRSKAKQLGCEPPVLVPGGGFLGLNHLRRFLDADSKGLFADLFLRRHEEMAATFGRIVPTFRFQILGAEIVHTSDSKNIQALLATQFNDFDLGSRRRGNMGAMLGDGIFVQDGKSWEHSRAMLRPNFVRDQVADLDLEEKHIRHLMLALPTSAETKGWTSDTNLQGLFFRLTLDSATEFLFGESVDSQLAELPDSDKIGHVRKINADEKGFAFAFDNGQKHLAKRFRLQDFWWIHNPKDFRDSCKVVNDFVDHYVEIALRKQSREKSTEEGLKSRYIFAESIANQTKDPKEIRAQLLNILLAGRDTTASLLSYLFHYLVRDPKEFEKLRASILEDFGTYESPKNISFATLKGSTYLQYCINETLRTAAVVPGNAREANKDTTLPRGGGKDGDKPIFIKKGQNVEYSVHVMHQRSDLWGPDSYSWRPSRWFDKRNPGWEYIPFNGGPRICIGQQFAIVEASYTTVRLLQRFDKLEAAGDELTRPVTANLTLTMAPGNGPIVRLHEASQA